MLYKFNLCLLMYNLADKQTTPVLETVEVEAHSLQLATQKAKQLATRLEWKNFDTFHVTVQQVT